jgi:hypothetical protein
MAVFWNVYSYYAPYILVDTDGRFRGSYCLYHQGDYDGGSELLRNVGHYLPDYSVQHSMRESFYTRRLENLKSQV